MEAFPSAEAFLFQWEERKDYDILLLDRAADGAVLPLPRGAYEGVERAIIRYT